MCVGQLCEMFAEFAYPREGQAVLTHPFLFVMHSSPENTRFIE